MKTSIEAVNILFSGIANSELKSLINGGIYKYQRPINSSKEDIVINSLPLNREDLQEGILNVNIYVPNLSLNLNNVTDNTQPDIKRLNELGLEASDYLSEIFPENENYHFELQQDNLLQDENEQHYINLRVMFRNLNY